MVSIHWAFKAHTRYALYFSEAGDHRFRGAGHSFCFYDFVENISVKFKFRLPDLCVVLYFKI